MSGNRSRRCRPRWTHGRRLGAVRRHQRRCAAVVGGADRVPTFGRQVQGGDGGGSARDPALYAAYTHYVVAQAIAQNFHRDNPTLAEQAGSRISSTRDHRKDVSNNLHADFI